jgi:hypothetical protein
MQQHILEKSCVFFSFNITKYSYNFSSRKAQFNSFVSNLTLEQNHQQKIYNFSILAYDDHQEC